MTFSQFAKHFNENKKHLAPMVAEEIRAEAMDRVIERMQAGRADSALCFADLVAKIEDAVSPK